MQGNKYEQATFAVPNPKYPLNQEYEDRRQYETTIYLLSSFPFSPFLP